MKTSSSSLHTPSALGRTTPCVGERSLSRLGLLLLAPALFAVPAPPARALAARTEHNPDKDTKKRQQTAVVRVAEGQVLNGAKKPLEGAIVYLEDPTSLTIKSYLTDATGHFHFNQLATQTDYEVWAEQNGTQSKHKFISQFSSHTHFDFQLTLDPDKKKKLLGFL